MSIKCYSKNTHTKPNKKTKKKKTTHNKYPICSCFPYIFWLENS